MQFFGETKIDFLGKRRYAAVLSALVILAGVVSLVLHGGPALGIDFAGGAQVVVRFATQPPINAMRDALTDVGLESAQLQEFEAESNEVLIKAPGEQGNEAEIVDTVDRALQVLDPPPADAGDRLDLNTVGREQLVGRLMEANPLALDVVVDEDGARERYRQAADRVLQPRSDEGMLASWDPVEASGADPRIVTFVRDGFYLGGHRILNVEWVGPQVGRDLRRQAVQAMTWALLGLMAYISYRFEFRFGVAAVVALVHDVTIAVGAFSITGREFNLPVIAAFLTIVGYSLNDTVVVFDRIRENDQSLRKMSVYDRINLSINQTLSRTVLTSGTTLLVVLSLYLYGGPVINDFAFALLVGVIVGTYSSVFVASPVVYVWHEIARQRAAR